MAKMTPIKIEVELQNTFLLTLVDKIAELQCDVVRLKMWLHTEATDIRRETNKDITPDKETFNEGYIKGLLAVRKELQSHHD